MYFHQECIKLFYTRNFKNTDHRVTIFITKDKYHWFDYYQSLYRF